MAAQRSRAAHGLLRCKIWPILNTEAPEAGNGGENSFMLVVTRRPGESVRVGDDIEITVVEVRGEQVRLAVRAPRDIPVARVRADGAAEVEA